MQKRARRRFTLIELLVTVAVIAMLAALLLPALKSAKEMGRRTACQNKLKQMGICLQMYAGDFQGFLPAGQAAGNTWDEMLMPYLENRFYSSGTSYITQPHFHCPSSSGWASQPTKPERWLGLALNGYIAKYFTSASTLSGHKPVVNVSWIVHPANLYTMGELELTDGEKNEYGTYNTFSTYIIPDSSINLMSWRHENAQNILFADGHTRSYKRKGTTISNDTGDPDPIPDGIEFKNGYTYGSGAY